jgi:hypothetical protein
MAGIGTYDVNGWTDLAPSGDSRIIYVSASGDNSYNGLSPIWTSGTNGPKRTIRSYFEGAVSTSVISPTTTLISSADAQQSSGYVGSTLYWTSGPLNGSNIAVTGYSVVSNEVRLATAAMTGVPTSGSTFYVAGPLGGGFSLMRDGYPDWLCLKCGDTFKESAGTGGITWEIGGRSITEPMVMTSYRMDGDTVIYGEGTRPIVKMSILYYNYAAVHSNDNIAFTNLDFKAYNTYSNFAFQWVGQTQNLLIEGCVLREWSVLADFQAINKYSPTKMEQVTNIIFRRNICYDGYGMGVMASNHNQFLVEENLFDHNGILTGTHNTLHNLYTQKIRNLVCRNNIFARGSNFGIKMSADFLAGNDNGDYSDYLVEDNLFYNNGIGNDWSGRLAVSPTTKFATQANISSGISPSGTSFVGSVISGTYSSTQTTNGTFHSIDDSGNIIDITYGWDMWQDNTVSADQWLDEGRVASGVTIAAYVQGSGDEMKVKAWNYTSDAWDTIGTLTGTDGTSVVTQNLSLTTDHTGPYGDPHQGKVYVRCVNDTTTPSNLSIDRLVLTAAPAYTHKNGQINRNVMTMAGRTWDVETAEWHPEVNAGQDLQGWLLSGDTIQWSGNLLIHMPRRSINAQPLAWSTNHTNVTVTDTIIYNWANYLHLNDTGVPDTSGELDYLNLNRVPGITVSNTQLTYPSGTNIYGYLDPTRSVAIYNSGVLGATVVDNTGIADDYAIDFLVAARSQLSKSNWNTDYTASVVNDWIRAGFNIESSGGSGDPVSSLSHYLISAGGLNYYISTGN